MVMVRQLSFWRWSAIFIALASCAFTVSRSEQEDGSQLGEQMMSQYCAPSGRRKHVNIMEVMLVCDYQSNGYGYNQNDDQYNSFQYNSYNSNNEDENNSKDNEDDGNQQYQGNQYYQYNGNQQRSYRNSPTCRPGDHAKVLIDFKIGKMRNYTMGMNMKAAFFGRTEIVAETTNLCYAPSLTYWGEDGSSASTAACPLRPGHYELNAGFTVPKFNIDDPDFSFTPALKIEFTDLDRKSKKEYIGCVETGTLAMSAIHESNSKRGNALLIALTCAFLAVFFVCVFSTRKKRRNPEDRRQIRRFHYHRSFGNGSVVVDLNKSDSGVSANPSLREVT